MTREEKIQLNDLIAQYVEEELEPRLRSYGYPFPPETKEEFLMTISVQKHIHTLKEIQELLCYDCPLSYTDFDDNDYNPRCVLWIGYYECPLKKAEE